MRGLSDAICRQVAEFRAAALPPAAAEAAKLALLDATGVMLAASGLSPEVQPFVSLAKAGGSGPCGVLGTGISATAPMAALANGAMAHALDFEDAFDRSPGHPNASLVPALIALAHAEGPVDGIRYLTALALGGDLSCRLGLALRQEMEQGGWYPPPILAGLGAAVGAAKLLGLDATATRDALSLMLCQSVMPGEIKHSQGTVIRAVREGFPAQGAVISALLAREGVAGFEEPLEGCSGFYALYAGGKFAPEDLLEGLGERFHITELTFKPWPSCRGTHAFIELALELAARHGFGPRDVLAIEAGIDRVQQMLVEPLARKQAPATVIDAKFSIPFCIAVAIGQGGVDLDSFSASALRDPALLDLSGKVSAIMDDNLGWQRGTGGRLAITLADGRRLEASCTTALGSPEKPLGSERLIAKFVDCAGRAARPLAEDKARALADRILDLENCADVGALLRA
ncbi:MmgE/PrpD family protein [Alteraurantiacibacter buctensis]|uniref:MmgE/PrpD family protein n=1 Tax=Alteraurantiacibacter buctensis TaxID=1503981 RepID=A0A844YZU8_9SPHN|nr:MmgE/PrpD family protein [Alteraurantiacibacter buctensis]